MGRRTTFSSASMRSSSPGAQEPTLRPVRRMASRISPGGQPRVFAHHIPLAAQAADHALQAAEDVQVAGADILLALAVVVVEHGQPLFRIGLGPKPQPPPDAFDDAVHVLLDGPVGIHRFAGRLVMQRDFAGQRSRFGHSGHLRHGNGPDDFQGCDAHGVLSPLTDGVGIQIDGIQHGNVQIGQGPAQIVVDGRVEFQ